MLLEEEMMVASGSHRQNTTSAGVQHNGIDSSLSLMQDSVPQLA